CHHALTTRIILLVFFFFFSSRRRHTRWPRDWSSDVCSSDLSPGVPISVCLEMDLERQEIANLEELKANPTAWGLANAVAAESGRSEERRVGKECRCGWSPYR